MSSDGEGVRTWLQANGWESASPTETALLDRIATLAADLATLAADLAAERAEVERLTDRIATLTEQNSELATNYVGLLDSLDATRFERDRLRTAGDALAEDGADWSELVAAWKEARRER